MCKPFGSVIVFLPASAACLHAMPTALPSLCWACYAMLCLRQGAGGAAAGRLKGSRTVAGGTGARERHVAGAFRGVAAEARILCFLPACCVAIAWREDGTAGETRRRTAYERRMAMLRPRRADCCHAACSSAILYAATAATACLPPPSHHHAATCGTTDAGSSSGTDACSARCCVRADGRGGRSSACLSRISRRIACCCGRRGHYRRRLRRV